jgi:SWI/SNF-related matrix-associated actin-dependent regulator of chromatin subfamily A3
MTSYAHGTTPTLSGLSISTYPPSNQIDLTLDDDDDDDDDHGNSQSPYSATREPKRQRIDTQSSPHAYGNPPEQPWSQITPSSHVTVPQGLIHHHQYQPAAHYNAGAFGGPQTTSLNNVQPSVNYATYRSTSTGSSSSSHGQFNGPSSLQPNPSTPLPHSPVSRYMSPNPSGPQFIDLTGSPSPPPTVQHTSNPLPPDLPPKTPVCIGELTVTALILYQSAYLHSPDPSGFELDWAPVRLQYEHNPNKAGATETIHIRTPHTRTPTGEVGLGEAFGVIEQKVATSLGPMLGKGLIRLDGLVRRGISHVSLTPFVLMQC